MTDGSPKRALAGVAMVSVLLMSAFVLLHAQPVGGQLSSPPFACYASFLAQEGDPVAEAGENITTSPNEHVTLNGSGSTGFEGPENLNYSWRVKYKSVTRILYGATPMTVFNRTDVAEVNLTVTDSLNRTDWDTTFIFVVERPPTWLEKHGLEVLGYGIMVAVLGTAGYVFGRRDPAGAALV